jgi:hypothetical protein
MSFKAELIGSGCVVLAFVGAASVYGWMMLAHEPVLACQDSMATIQVLEARLAELEKAPRTIQAENVTLSVYPVERIPYQRVSKP